MNCVLSTAPSRYSAAHLQLDHPVPNAKSRLTISVFSILFRSDDRFTALRSARKTSNPLGYEQMRRVPRGHTARSGNSGRRNANSRSLLVISFFLLPSFSPSLSAQVVPRWYSHVSHRSYLAPAKAKTGRDQEPYNANVDPHRLHREMSRGSKPKLGVCCKQERRYFKRSISHSKTFRRGSLGY